MLSLRSLAPATRSLARRSLVTLATRASPALLTSATRTSFASARLPTGIRMSSHAAGEDTVRPDADKVIADIAEYVHTYKVSCDGTRRGAELTPCPDLFRRRVQHGPSLPHW